MVKHFMAKKNQEGKSNYLVSLSVTNHLEELMQEIYFRFCKPSTISCDSVNFISWYDRTEGKGTDPCTILSVSRSVMHKERITQTPELSAIAKVTWELELLRESQRMVQWKIKRIEKENKTRCLAWSFLLSFSGTTLSA